MKHKKTLPTPHPQDYTLSNCEFSIATGKICREFRIHCEKQSRRAQHLICENVLMAPLNGITVEVGVILYYIQNQSQVSRAILF